MFQHIQRINDPKLKAFIPGKQGVPAFEAIRKAGEAGMTIASNERIGKALVDSEEWKSLDQAFPCWTGTMAAYVEPGKAFCRSKRYSQMDNAISYRDPRTDEVWMFPVGPYKKEKNAVLVAEHPNYSVEKQGSIIFVHPEKTGIILNFPENDGWHLRDSEYDIPAGGSAEKSDPEARYLWRLCGGKGKIGLVARGYDDVYYYRKFISMEYEPSFNFGVIAESKG